MHPEAPTSADASTNGDVILVDAAGATASGPRVIQDTNANDASSTTPTHTNNVIVTDSDDVTATDTEDAVSADTGTVVGANTKDLITTETKDAGTDTSTTVPHPSSPVSLDDIDVATIPTFLLRHGTGKRQVNIFNYLKSVKDIHFQRVLVHYLHFEINNKSGLGGSLPTAGRPVEIGQWSSRARPPGLPDYTKGKRTLSTFVDSILMWWASIQPSWRTFERGRVCREVCGDWGVLSAPRTNGLLNVVMLVYWWAKILEEDKPEDGMRADYKLFADDVAWVLSNLST